ncbi:hypothetical protein M0638_28160, partial [Roseomonas sp. NAR14]
RFWPLACRHADVPWIREWRNQLWAEAAAREAAGEAWWLSEEPAQQGAATEQAARLIVDAWGDKVRGSILGRSRVTTAELLGHVLEIPIAQQNKAAQMRVAGILKGEGWKRERTAGSRYWIKEAQE